MLLDPGERGAVLPWTKVHGLVASPLRLFGAGSADRLGRRVSCNSPCRQLLPGSCTGCPMLGPSRLPACGPARFNTRSFWVTSLLLGHGLPAAGQGDWHSERGSPMRNADFLTVELVPPELISRWEPQQLRLFPYLALIAALACLLRARRAPAFQPDRACQRQLGPLPFLVT